MNKVLNKNRKSNSISKNSRFYLIVLIIMNLCLVLSLEYAEAKKKKKRKASVNFEDELIHGDVKGSELLYFLKRKQVNYKKLIKLRKNFLPEMRRSGEEIQKK